VSVALQVAWHLGYASTDGLHGNKKFRAAYKRECAARNPDVYRDAECKRKRHLNNTPAWANKDKIIAFYRTAKDLGLSVDHEVPLQGRNVCGLHVENNLRLVSHLENSRKSNRFTPCPDWQLGTPG
jgi:Tol biopolymer transport system component